MRDKLRDQGMVGGVCENTDGSKHWRGGQGYKVDGMEGGNKSLSRAWTKVAMAAVSLV